MGVRGFAALTLDPSSGLSPPSPSPPLLPGGSANDLVVERGEGFPCIMSSAQRCPLKHAPSIVPGNPVLVQSPPTQKFLIGDDQAGRNRSLPTLGESVACVSLITSERNIEDFSANGNSRFNSSKAMLRIFLSVQSIKV